jgi:aminoglycoside phosphotransferase (APT) family kinase protein
MDFSAPHLSRYLAHKLGRPVEVREVERFSRGTSRQTWFVTLAGQTDRTLVFRIDHPTGSIEPSPLSQEYFMYDRLGRTAVPVARALWWEEDPDWTSRPFYVREKVAGNWNIPHFLDPDLPVMLEAAEWLKESAPVAPRICLCKGTNGFGEEIWQGSEIVAMSDWEEASIGDPAADFAFMQYLAPELERGGRKIWGLAHALEYYRQVSGISVTPEAVRFYGVIRAMRLIIMSVKAGRSVSAAPDRAEIRQAWTATEVGHVCRRALIAAMGLTSPPPASVLAEFHETIEAPL